MHGIVMGVAGKYATDRLSEDGVFKLFKLSFMKAY